MTEHSKIAGHLRRKCGIAHEELQFETLVHLRRKPRRARALGAPGPSVASAGRRRRGRPLDAPRVGPGGHDEFLRKSRFVRDLVLALLPLSSPDDAAAWTLPFADEGDPTFPIRHWIESGWRNPLLVDAALRVCGTREKAEACMARLEREVGSRYEPEMVRALAEAMLYLKQP